MSKRKDRNYFITPTRLMKYPHFYKNIQMIRTLNKDQSIVMPEATLEWLRYQWHLISPENVMLCMDMGGSYRISWDASPKAASDLFDYILKKADTKQIDLKVEIAITNKFLKEESFNKYIKNIISKVEAKWINAFISTAARYPLIQTYQIETLWKLTPEPKRKYVEWLYSVSSTLIPDYIIKECALGFLEDPATFIRRYQSSSLVIEMVERKMLEVKVPSSVVVASQPEPTFETAPVVEKPSEKPKLPSYSRGTIVVNI